MYGPFNFLGFDFDAISRAAEKYAHTWDQAIAAASRFSEGRACTVGIGPKGEPSKSGPESTREGSFNICYWVKVDGNQTEWVVRFPKPIASESVIRTKLRSEVATLKFLKQHTKVPVPTLIGYDVGTDDSPPFLIMENVDGIRLSILWKVDPSPRQVNLILNSLAEIQYELLAHPFDKIGMLDISSSEPFENKLIEPASLDSLEHCRDQVPPIPSPPFESPTERYDHKLAVALNRLHNQRNSISSLSDGRRKFLNFSILREYQEYLQNTDGPCHPEPLFGAGKTIAEFNIGQAPGKSEGALKR